MTSLLRYALLWLLVSTLTAAAQGNSETQVFQRPVNVKEPAKDFLTVRDSLAGAPVIRSRFKQKKSIAVLKKPLISSGNFIFSEKKGLYWNIGAPINTSYVLTPSYLVERQKGYDPKVITPKEQPALFGLTEVFEAIFVGDLDKLSQDFVIHFLGTPQEWTIGLVPRKGVLKQMFKRVVLKGGSTVGEVMLFEGNGDSTHIKFSETTRAPASLSASEKALFAR